MVANYYPTHLPINQKLKETQNFVMEVPVIPGGQLASGVPMERDLRFMWEEMPQETLDENNKSARCCKTVHDIGKIQRWKEQTPG